MEERGGPFHLFNLSLLKKDMCRLIQIPLLHLVIIALLIYRYFILIDILQFHRHLSNKINELEPILE